MEAVFTCHSRRAQRTHVVLHARARLHVWQQPPGGSETLRRVQKWIKAETSKRHRWWRLEWRQQARLCRFPGLTRIVNECVWKPSATFMRATTSSALQWRFHRPFLLVRRTCWPPGLAASVASRCILLLHAVTVSLVATGLCFHSQSAKNKKQKSSLTFRSHEFQLHFEIISKIQSQYDTILLSP